MTGFSVDANFVRFGDTRFATNKITSFSVARRIRNVQGSNDRFAAFAVGFGGFLLGLIILSNGLEDGSYGQAFVGAAVGGGAGLLITKARSMPSNPSRDETVYTLMIVTNAGETAAYETTSADDMSEVETALEQAILGARR